jgi:REP element-mobilizing transposase RayT
MAVETFNLDAPPNFRGLHPDLKIEMYTRHLPHWRQQGATYAVTFRLADSLPKEKLELLKSMRRHWEANHPEPRSEEAWKEYAKKVTANVDKWLDQGAGECHFKRKEFADELARSILHFQDQQYFVGCYVVMPNHCHLVIRPNDGFELEDIVGSIKGVVSRFVNKANGTTGSLWQQECFDRIIRDEEHLYNTVQYIGKNPRLAGLPKSQWFRWVHPEWEKVGWGFRDV